ncbi:MAG: ATP-binding cassette domain-containing protein [Anaerolineae bacterium]|jgi:ABC-2 type transport system ATP-binding protein|nr:ATP-binding cassette domain-containing protein [Anaerolineae bacterium]
MVIQVENLSKIYRINQKTPGLGGALKSLFRPQYLDKVAVDGISFEVGQGEIVGYIGVNGAGKSTTIKMLTGILAPTTGSVRVLGRDPHQERVANAREIGAVFGQRTQLWWDLALIESLNMIGKLYDLPPAHYRDQLARFTEMLDLGEILHIPIRNMSLGQKMRAELAATLIHDPKVVYLDEPTIGLDLMVKEKIRAFIKQENRERGITVVLTTHDLGDIEELCQRVIMIDMGKVIYDGALQTIRDRFGKYRTITLELSAMLGTGDLDLLDDTEIEAIDGHKWRIRFDRTRTSASKVAAHVMNQVDVNDFSLTEPDLTGIVKQIYQGALNDIKVSTGELAQVTV